MNAAREDRASELFHRALGVEAGERGAFVARQCGGDEGLLAEVESLLAADGCAGGFLEPASALEAPVEARPGARIGSYRVRRAIGAGGMGVVYEAEQDHPHRTVALKVIRRGTPAALRRFEFEAEALGRLHHPGIAQVYESGVWEGAPFIAMEWIAGARTATAGLDHRRASDVMAKVCDAVRHAHQHGVIHRDLKPGNILMGEDGEPKIIDFGVARIVGADRPATTLAGQLVGTLDYMSPEQCAGEALDTRTDIYSLGVVLFEMLTGSLPHALEGTTVLEASRVIRQEPVRRPSAIRPVLRGDLETIVLKALEKEPARRYQSAADLARDLRAFLAGGAIDARRDSTWYVVRKALRRHRGPAAAAGMVVVTLAISSGALAVMYERQGRLLSTVHRRETEASRALSWLQGTLASLDPESVNAGDTRALRMMLDDASRRVGVELADQPEAQGAMRTTIGRLYAAIGLFGEAEAQLRSALALRRALHPGDHADTATTMCDLAEALQEASRYAEAEPLFAAALEMRKRVLPDPHPDLAHSLSTMAWPAATHRHYGKSRGYLESALAMYRRVYGEEHAKVAETLNGLGAILYAAGEYAEAERVLEESLVMTRRVLGDRHAGTAPALMNLAKLRQARGREAEGAYREALAIYQEHYGERHPNVAWARHRLGMLLHEMARNEEAREMIEAALSMYREFQGEIDPYTAYTLESLGTLKLDGGELEGAGECFEAAIAIWRAIEGGEAGKGGAFSDWHLNRMGCLLAARGDPGAEAMLQRALAARDERSGESGPAFAASATALGKVLAASGRVDEGRNWLLEVYELEKRNRGENHPRTRAAREAVEACK